MSVIISCAVTGAADSVGANPAVPVTPEEIANEALAANKAGAAIVHIHVRNPETGKASMNPALYKEVVDRIRDANAPVIINLTTGPGARLVPNLDDPSNIAEGSVMKTAEERLAHVIENKPDICSLDVATMNFGDRPMVNAPDMLNKMATMIQDAGVKPELEVFDTGHVRLANHMVETGVIKDDKPLYQLCLGIPWGAPATAEMMMAMRGHAAGQRQLGVLRHLPLRVPDGGQRRAARRPLPRRAGGQPVHRQGRTRLGQRPARRARGRSRGVDGRVGREREGSAGDTRAVSFPLARHACAGRHPFTPLPNQATA